MQPGHFLHQGLVCLPELKVFGNISEGPVYGPGKSAGDTIHCCILELIKIEKQNQRYGFKKQK
jgi:hypothetical protein